MTLSLEMSVIEGNLAEFRTLIADIDDESFQTTVEYGNTLVHLAVIYNHPEILNELIQINAQLKLSILEYTNDSGFTPHDCVYLYSAPKTAQFLIKSPLSRSGNLVISKDYQKMEELPVSGIRGEGLGKIMMFASALNDTKTLEILFRKTNKPEELLHYQTNDGWSGLHFAAFNNHLDVMKFFLDKALLSGRDIKDLRDKNGNTPLIIAAGKGNLELIGYLLTEGSDLNQTNHLGGNAVLAAAEKGQLDTLIFFFGKNVDQNAVNKNGENAAMLAAAHGHLDMFIFLMEHEVPVDLKDKEGRTIFERALESGQIKIADLLASRSTQEEINKALFQAVKRNDLVVVKWLVEHGASLSAVGDFKLTPMLLAVRQNKLEIINYFLSLTNPPIHHRDNDGDNALFFAIKIRQEEVVACLIESNFFSWEEKNSKGLSPLLVAAQVNDEDLVASFHEKGCSLEEEDEEGNNAMHLLLVQGYLGETLNYLLTQAPNLLLKKNKKGETPLHTAVLHKRGNAINEIVDFLNSSIEKKTEALEAKDEQGNTPLLTAVASYSQEAILILLDAGANILATNNKNKSVITLTYLSTFYDSIQQRFFSAYHIDYREYLDRRRLYITFGEKMNDVLKFPGNEDVKFGSGLFDEGVQILNNHLKTFLQEKHPELSSKFELLLKTLDKLKNDATPEALLSRLDADGIAFQATGFVEHGVFAALKNMPDGNMKLSISERGANVGGAPFLSGESKKFSSVRSLIVPKEKREEVIRLLHQAKRELQKRGVDILFKQIPELVGTPYQFLAIYQKKFLDICFYSNPKTGLYEQFIDILGENKGKTFSKEFERYIREEELNQYKVHWKERNSGNNLLDNPIVVEGQRLIDQRVSRQKSMGREM